MIFVFGSNEAGRHGKGAAAFARRNHGAVYGQGWGRQGNSFAIPTKDAHLRSLPLKAIQGHVEAFMAYASLHPELQFRVTRIGCGLAGYCDEDIAPMFKDAPENCHLPEGWRGMSAEWPAAYVPPSPPCGKCGGTMRPSKAIEQTWVGSVTVSPGGPGKLVNCLKCSLCGWSITT